MDTDLSRRDFLKIGAGGAAAAGGAKAVHNVVLGYDKNLKSQNLRAVASEDFEVPFEYETVAGGVPVRLYAGTVEAGEEDFRYSNTDAEEAAALDESLGTEGALEQLAADLKDFEKDNYAFEFHEFDGFFQRANEAETRGYTADAVRGEFEDVPAPTVEAFVGETPTEVRDFLFSLREAFRNRTSYDVPRYIAGALTDNVFMKRVRLRPYFEQNVEYGALNSREKSRMFCYEYNYRAAEGLHSVPAHEQSPPAIGARVRDLRHKHVYTGVATVVRDESVEPSLRVPMTFVDYTRSTLSDMFYTTLLGDNINAYTSGHRADAIEWSRNS